jgi:hypothetical protein
MKYYELKESFDNINIKSKLYIPSQQQTLKINPNNKYGRKIYPSIEENY